MTSPTTSLLCRLRRLTGTPTPTAEDGVLLERFLRRRDESAFAELVRRHGGLVQGVCRRVLGQEEDAEDAFQATFLVLARRAHAIRRPGSLAAWLYGVAHRVALKARTARAHVPGRQPLPRAHPRDPHPDPLAELSARELLGLLDAELQRLPEVYRLPLLLCCLEGRTQEEAARQLGWTSGSVKGRLERGRALLQRRLARHGVALSAGLLAMPCGKVNSARAALVGKMAAGYVAGESHTVAPQVSALAHSAAQGMALNKARWVLSLVVVLGFVLAGSGILLRPEPSAEPGTGKPPPAAKEKETVLRDFHGDPLPPGAVARLGTVRRRHAGWITSLAWSHDGMCLVTGGWGRWDHSVRLWDPKTGKELRRFTGSTRAVNGVTFSPDDELIAAVDGDGTVRVWQAQTGKPVFTKERLLGSAAGRAAGSRIDCLAFSPDGKLLAAGGGGNGHPALVVLAMPSGKVLHALGDKKASVRCVAFSPDGKLLAAGEDPYLWNSQPGRKGKAPAGVRLWDVRSGKEHRFLDGHPEVTGVAFSPDGKRLASGGQDAHIRLWDVVTGKMLRQMVIPPTDSRDPIKTGRRIDYGSYDVAFSPDGRWLASANHNSTITLWDLPAKKKITLRGHGREVSAVAFSPDGKVLASGSYDHTFRLWDPATGKPLPTLSAHAGEVMAISSPDGKLAATAGEDHTIRLWDLRTGRPRRVLHRPEMDMFITLAFSPDGKRLAWKERNAIHLREVFGKEGPSMVLKHPAQPCDFAFSPDGKWLVSTGPSAPGQDLNLIRLWDLGKGKQVATIRPDRICAWEVAFSPDGRWIAAQVSGGEVTLWDRATHEEVRRFPSLGGYLFSPDGKVLATGVDEQHIQLWDPATGRERGRIRCPAPGEERIYPMAFSRDGRLLVCLDKAVSKEAFVMEVATGKLRRKLTGHQASILSAGFTPDGRYLLTGSVDTTALVWDLWDGGRVLPATMSARQMRSAWEELAGEDGVAAGEAIARLAATRGQAVRFLREHLHPVKPPDPEALAGLIADLDSDSFAVRQRAIAQLQKLGERATGALRKAAAKGRSLEVRRRAEELLRPYAGLVTTPEGMQAVRAVEVLERMATPEARELLRRLAGGARGARLTEEAREALGRKKD
jgi:RNA polymerase sigma factor (sigma-70 family)